MSDIYFDEPNDNIPCPVCGQDQCVCDIDIDDYYDYISDSPGLEEEYQEDKEDEDA